MSEYKPKGHTIVTVPLDPALHKALRVYCASNGMTIKDAVTRAIRKMTAVGGN